MARLSKRKTVRVKNQLENNWSFTQDLFNEFSEDNCFRLAAALSYYAVFSLAPMMIIIIAVAGAFFGREAVSGEVFRQANGLIGAQGAQTLEALVQSAYLEKSGFVTTVIAAITLLVSATTLFAVIQDSLNTIWKVRVKPGQSILKYMLTRILSFGMVLVVGGLLIASLIINTVIVALQGYISALLNQYTVYAIQVGQNAASLAIITLLFAVMFKYLPDVHIPWKRVWRASFITAILFTIGKSLIGFYLGHANPGSTYGAAASLIIILLWVNYSAWIFFLGAEYIYVSMLRAEVPIIPTKYAARLLITVEEE
jgi:membrane protein